jgi:hypothetical protein
MQYAWFGSVTLMALLSGCASPSGNGNGSTGDGGSSAGGEGGGEAGDSGASGRVFPDGTGGTAQTVAQDAAVPAGGSRGGGQGGGQGGSIPMPKPDAGADDAPTGPVAIVAVGYAGRRVVSLDLGKTWIGDQKLGGGGDDQFLLRDGTVAKGRFVAVGWKILSSTDGLKWTEHTNPHGQWHGGVAFGNGIFLAVGGLGQASKSSDGVNWQRAANAGNSHIRRVVFDGTKFWASGDSGTVYSTTNGVAWTTGGNFPPVNDTAGNVQVRMTGAGLMISTDGGKTFKVGISGGGIDGGGIGFL